MRWDRELAGINSLYLLSVPADEPFSGGIACEHERQDGSCALAEYICFGFAPGALSRTMLSHWHEPFSESARQRRQQQGLDAGLIFVAQPLNVGWRVGIDGRGVFRYLVRKCTH